MEYDEDEIELTIEPSEDGSEVVLRYRSRSGRPVTMEEFYLEIEAHAKDVLRAQGMIQNSVIH